MSLHAVPVLLWSIFFLAKCSGGQTMEIVVARESVVALQLNAEARSNEETDIDDDLMTCNSDEYCEENYTPNLQTALEYNSSVVHKPFCQFPVATTSSRDGNYVSVQSLQLREMGVCTCGDYCKSYSVSTKTFQKFYYCGPCGRVGSQCINGTICTHTMAECEDEYCVCKHDGTFYDLFYCYIPYYGYEVALQMAIATCIIIAGCLILVSLYNAIGLRRLRRIQSLREILLRREHGVRESPPEDVPPKYDDVVEDLPSYQEALTMNGGNCEQRGIYNLAFEENSVDSASLTGTVGTTNSLPRTSSGQMCSVREESIRLSFNRLSLKRQSSGYNSQRQTVDRQVSKRQNSEQHSIQQKLSRQQNELHQSTPDIHQLSDQLTSIRKEPLSKLSPGQSAKRSIREVNSQSSIQDGNVDSLAAEKNNLNKISQLDQGSDSESSRINSEDL